MKRLKLLIYSAIPEHKRTVFIIQFTFALSCIGFILTQSFTFKPPLDHPVLFVSRTIPCCGSVYMADANALPGVGGFSKYQVASPAFLCLLQPDGRIDTLIDGSKPTPESMQLTDISTPVLNWAADRIVFAGLPEGNYVEGNNNMTPNEHNAWRIYTIAIDGSDLRQITFNDPQPELSQFHPLAQDGQTGYDDTHPAWLPDGRIVFSSTRFPGIAMYNVTRVSNLFVVNDDGTDLHRITSEKNGADRPVVDPLTGRIVFSRWWRNFYWPYDGMESVASSQYPGGWTFHNGLTSDLNSVIDGQQYMFNNNSFFLTEINPDGTGLKLFGAHYREISANSCYGGNFDPEGNFVGNWFPIEHSTESSGFGGIKRYFRGPGPQPEGLAGITEYGNLDYYIKNPPSYGILNGNYAAEPFVLEDGRILFSKATSPEQDYGIFMMNSDGSGEELLIDIPGMTDLNAQLVKPRPLPPVIPDLVTQVAENLPPTGLDDLRDEGTFSFDCRNIYYNAPVDVEIISAPAVGDVGSVRFFASPLLDQQFGSVEALDFPLLYNEIDVDEFGRVFEPDAPAHVPLFEQARSPEESGYHIPRTGGGIMNGAAQVMGFNYGRPGQAISCVGCHNGHSMIPVPSEPNELMFTNLAPGAEIIASSSMNDPGFAIDRKNFTSGGKHWFTPEGEDPNKQWLELQWMVPVWTKSIVLHNVPFGRELFVHRSRLTLYSDKELTQEVFSKTLEDDLSDEGTEISLPDIVEIQGMKLEFLECSGGIYHWDCAAIGDIEVIASPINPNRFSEITDCMGNAYGSFQKDTCGQCLLPDDPLFNNCGTTGTTDSHENNKLRLWPNPATNTIWVEISDISLSRSWTLWTLHGNMVGEGILDEKVSKLRVGQYAKGVYLFRYAEGNRSEVVKVVIH